MPETSDLPDFPGSSGSARPPPVEEQEPPQSGSKRKAAGGKGGKGKKPKKVNGGTTAEADAEVAVDGAAPIAEEGEMDVDDTEKQQAEAIAAGFFGVLDAESLRMPTMPSKDEMGKILLEVRKKALLAEYGV